MTLSFRTKLLASHIALALVVGGIGLFVLDRWLTSDLIQQLDQRMEEQGKGALEWAEGGKRHPDRITTRIAHIVDAEVTLFDADGTLIGASVAEAREDVGPEVDQARHDGIGKAARRRRGEEVHYIAVRGDDGTILRLAQPLSEIQRTVAATRQRLLFASSVAVLAAIILGFLATRGLTQPIAELTSVAERLERGEYDAPIAEGAHDELGVLRRAMKSLAAQLKARIGELVSERDRLSRLMIVRRDFVANVSHELRTPVTSIQGYAETLVRKDPKPEMRQQFLEVIHRQAQRIGALVEQLLALSELEAKSKGELDRERVELIAVARHVTETVAGHAEKRKAIVSIDVPADVFVLANPEGVERAILNLVDNAVKYGKDGGKVVISAQNDGERVTIDIADDGEGIAEQHLPRLFERFYRVDAGRSRESGGAGLGLAIVKHLVESMDGTITVESKVGEGTRFRVVLPSG